MDASTVEPNSQAPSRVDWIDALIEDRRDLPFLSLMVRALVWGVVGTVALYANYRWWMTPIYLAVTLGYFFPPVTLMLHCTSHRPLFRKRFRWMNEIVPWVVSPFFGQTPGTYGAHHLGMHHPENNLWDDESTTLPFRRDSLIDFVRYWGRFMTVGLVDLTRYLWRTRRKKLARRALIGELGFWALGIALLFVNAPATLTVFFAPVLFARFGMMVGNWAQHAFVDPESPGLAYRNSITCINVGYNERCFNDGYHIGHHLHARMHWTEYPAEFERNRERYAQERAIVFDGIDYFLIWGLLMIKDYRRLARRVVPLGEALATEEQRIAVLRSRTVPVPRPAA